MPTPTTPESQSFQRSLSRRLRNLGAAAHLPTPRRFASSSGGQQQTALGAETSFRMVHTPDRPQTCLAPAHLPSDADCLAAIQAWQGENEEERERERRAQDSPAEADTIRVGESTTAPGPRPVLRRKTQRIEDAKQQGTIQCIPLSSQSRFSFQSDEDSASDSDHQSDDAADDGKNTVGRRKSRRESSLSVSSIAAVCSGMYESDDAGDDAQVVDVEALFREEIYRRTGVHPSSQSPSRIHAAAVAAYKTDEAVQERRVRDSSAEDRSVWRTSEPATVPVVPGQASQPPPLALQRVADALSSLDQMVEKSRALRRQRTSQAATSSAAGSGQTQPPQYEPWEQWRTPAEQLEAQRRIRENGDDAALFDEIYTCYKDSPGEPPETAAAKMESLGFF